MQKFIGYSVINLTFDYKVIYVLRNPKDLKVSAYHFLQKIQDDKFIGSLEDMVDMFVDGTSMKQKAINCKEQ